MTLDRVFGDLEIAGIMLFAPDFALIGRLYILVVEAAYRAMKAFCVRTHTFSSLHYFMVSSFSPSAKS